MTRVNFDYVKEHAEFTAVLAHYNITIIGTGDQVRIKCPFHDDEHPSCSVNLQDKVFSCKAGSCGKNGNILHFVQEIEGCDVRKAAIEVAGICGIGTSAPAGGSGKPTEARERRRGGKDAPEAETAAGGDPAPNEAVFDPEGAERWLERNRLDPDHPYLVERIGEGAVRWFQPCGYASRGVMRGRAVLPLRLPAGELVGFMGRWTGDLGELPEDEEKYKIPKGFPKSRFLFGLHEEWVQRSAWLIVVEGAFSVIRLWREDPALPAVGLLGSTVSEAQIALLREHCPRLRQIVVLMDGDEGGRKAADAMAPLLARAYPTRIVDLPEDGEPDTVDLDVLREIGIIVRC